jgi:serine/threonine-protein kinase
MLANADEVFSGEVKHALRFILPNERIRDGIYVPPATHSSFPTSGGPNLPPYGVRLRLKASFNVNSLTAPGARTIAKALQHYGMFLSDGGNIPLTLASDRFTTHKWSEVGITNDLALASLAVTDFEVVDMGTPVDWNADTDCYRNP